MPKKAKQVHWRDKPVRNVREAVGRSLLRHRNRRASPMSMAMVKAFCEEKKV